MTDRNYAISAVRFIAMLMIITCHIMQYLELELAWWFNVGVQIFFVISGFLYGSKTIEKPIEFYKKSFKKLLIPYWTFLIITVILQRIFVPNVFSWGKTILAFLCIDRLVGIEHLWFVQTILICYLLLPLLLLLKNEIFVMTRAKALLSIIFVFLMLQFVGFTFNGYYMSANNISCFAMGIVLAGIFQKYNSLFKPTVIFAVLAVLTNIIRIYCIYIRGINDNLIINLFVKYAHGFLGIALFLILYRALKNIKSNVVLRFSDRYSYHIYLIHQIFILGPFSLMCISEFTAVSILIICACILVSGVLLKQVSRIIERTIFKFNKL